MGRFHEISAVGKGYCHGPGGSTRKFANALPLFWRNKKRERTRSCGARLAWPSPYKDCRDGAPGSNAQTEITAHIGDASEARRLVWCIVATKAPLDP